MRSPSSFLAALSLCVTAASAHAQSAIYGSSANDVWATDRSARVSHFNGQGWVSMPATTNQMVQVRAIYAPSAREAWLVGDDGLILHLSGNAWQYVRAPYKRDLVAINGCGPNDIWIVGQSDDMSRPPLLFHYNGQAWTSERAPQAFRAAGLTATCTTVTGQGGGGIAIAGSTYFDPRPDQRRTAGVLLQRSGSTWVTRGYDGRGINDQTLGTVGWTGITGCGATLLLSGEADGGPVMLRSSGSGWTRVPPPTIPENNGGNREHRVAITCDGTPVVTWSGGFGRYVNGQWAMVTGTSAQGAQLSMEQLGPIYASFMQRFMNLQQSGRAVPRAMQDSMVMMQRMIQGASGQMMAAAQSQQGFMYGDDAATWGPSGSLFYVATEQGKIFKVAGDSSAVVWDAMCVQMPSMEPCSTNGARGVSLPAPAQGAAPEAPEETEEAAPQAAPSPKRLLPSVPRLPRRP